MTVIPEIKFEPDMTLHLPKNETLEEENRRLKKIIAMYKDAWETMREVLKGE